VAYRTGACGDLQKALGGFYRSTARWA